MIRKAFGVTKPDFFWLTEAEAETLRRLHLTTCKGFDVVEMQPLVPIAESKPVF
jgi:hypothetical protein